MILAGTNKFPLLLHRQGPRDLFSVMTPQVIRNRLSDHQHCDQRSTGGEQAPLGDICSASVFCRNKKAFKMILSKKIFFFFKQKLNR